MSGAELGGPSPEEMGLIQPEPVDSKAEKTEAQIEQEKREKRMRSYTLSGLNYRLTQLNSDWRDADFNLRRTESYLMDATEPEAREKFSEMITEFQARKKTVESRLETAENDALSILEQMDEVDRPSWADYLFAREKD